MNGRFAVRHSALDRLRPAALAHYGREIRQVVKSVMICNVTSYYSVDRLWVLGCGGE